MELFGKLGIDSKLLIAQIVNFGVLLWLLSRFIYKPIIKRIEKDENELAKSAKLRKKLEEEISSFEHHKQKETIAVKNRAMEIIHESENIAKQIEKEAASKISTQTEKLIKQSRENIDTLRNDIESELFKSTKSKLTDSFQQKFSQLLSPSDQAAIQKIFWSKLLTMIEKVQLPKQKQFEMTSILERLEKKISNLDNKSNLPKKMLEDIYAKSIKPIILEYAYDITKEEQTDLEKLLEKKVGYKISFDKKENKNLVNGFRFEIAGIILESNLNIMLDHESPNTK